MNLPILMYHDIARDGAAGSDLTVTPEAFAAHMDWLARRGYYCLNLWGLLQSVRQGLAVPSRSVVITFDDALLSVWTAAKPILDQHQFTATVFAVAGSLGGRTEWDQGNPSARVRPCLSADQLKQLALAGWEIGSHGLTHANLKGADPQTLSLETSRSRHELEKALAVPVRVFAYPYGAWDAAAREAVARAGYLGACAISPGTWSVTSDLLALRRVYVKPTDSPADFARKVSKWYLSYRGLTRR